MFREVNANATKSGRNFEEKTKELLFKRAGGKIKTSLPSKFPFFISLYIRRIREIRLIIKEKENGKKKN